MLACVQFIVRLQLVHVSVRLDHSEDQGLRVEVVYVNHMPHSISVKLNVRPRHGLRVARVGMVHVSHKPDSGLWKKPIKKCLQA